MGINIFKTIPAILFLLIPNLFVSGDSKITFDKAVIGLNNKRLLVEVADTPVKHKVGLMFRKSLKKDRGMLFIFDYPQILSFWMKNTLIPLDIGFFDENKRLFEVFSMKPKSNRVYSSSNRAKYALEVNRGWFKKSNIAFGSRFIILKKLLRAN